MKVRGIYLASLCMATAVFPTVLTGCRKEPPATGNDKVQAGVLAKLAEADQLDGTADRIVSKCASCAFRMEGHSQHALKASNYTLHFCSEGCKKGFATDTTRSILAMEIPES